LVIENEDFGDGGLFIIKDYSINIKYKYSKYLGLDSWSTKMDIDIFFYIFSNYKRKSFYIKFENIVFIENT
jgi:hypothetical protein